MIRYLAALLVACFALPAEAQKVTTGPPVNMPSVLCRSSASSGMSHTGNLNETVVVTCNVPANTMGPSGCLYIDALFTYDNNANNKTTRVRFSGLAGSAYSSAIQTNTLGVRHAGVRICNRGLTNSQVGGTGTAFLGDKVTSIADTTLATSVVLTCQLATASDTCVVESYSVTVTPGP